MRDAVLVRVVLTACLIAGCGSNPTTVAPSGGPPSAPLPTASQPPEALSNVYRSWTQAAMPISVPGVFGGNSPNAVTRFGELLVAVGSVNGGCCDASFSTDTRGLVWTSDDGLEWDLVPDAPVFALGMLNSVAATSTEIVAVGMINRESTDDDGAIDRMPAVWVSEDARSWTRIEQVPAFVDLEALGEGFVAVAQTDRGPEVWSSADGRSWRRIADASTMGGGEARRLVATARGVMIIGSDQRSGAAAIWQSGDGLRWARVTAPLAAANVYSVDDAVDFGERLVAIGPTEDGTPAVLVSSGGLEWRRLDGARLTSSDVADMVVAGKDGLLLVGAVAPPGQEGPRSAAAWSSPDGLGWSRIEASAAMQDIGEIADGVAFGDGIVIVGRGRSHDQAETFIPAAWLIR